MHWRFPTRFLGGNAEEQTQPNQQNIPTESWYPSSVVGSPNSSHPTLGSSTIGQHRASDQPESPSRAHASPAEAAGIIAKLKDKSVDELKKLLNDANVYEAFFNSLDQVKIQKNLHDEFGRETLQIAKENLEKEPRISELQNQCTIIHTTELAAALEKLNELETQKEETLKFYSPASLLRKLHDAIDKVEEECEALQRQLLEKEIDLTTFVQKYKQLRMIYHRRSLVHLAAKTSF